jgi:hypothetical protein
MLFASDVAFDMVAAVFRPPAVAFDVAVAVELVAAACFFFLGGHLFLGRRFAGSLRLTLQLVL